VNLISSPVPHRLLLGGLLLPLSEVLYLLLYLYLIEVRVGRLTNGSSRLCHILCCDLSIGHVPEGALLKIEMCKNSTN
jgi:hypothetical protein